MKATADDMDFKSTAQQPAQRRRLSDLLIANPDVNPYAEGWYVIDFSAHIKTDKLISKKFLGEDVVIYRDTQSHEVVVVQAHCPHMGAHFDSYQNGGCVKDGVLTCPYHLLQYDAQGRRVDIKANSPRANLKKYQTLEHNGFVFALYQNDFSAGPIAIELDFPGMDTSAYPYANQTLGVFDGDPLVALMANADYHHFHSVHGRNSLRSDHRFSVSSDGRECHFSFEIDDTVPGLGDPEYPRAGRFKRLRKMLARPSILHPKGGMTSVSVVGRGPGMVVSRWVQTAFSTDLVTWLYATPITPHKFELYLCHRTRTLKQFKSPTVQKMMDAFSAKSFMWSMHLFVGQEDPPFYSNLKIRLDRPVAGRNDQLLTKYMAWWRSFFSEEFRALTAGYDIDFT